MCDLPLAKLGTALGGCPRVPDFRGRVVPMVVSNISFPTVAGNRIGHRASLKHNGQRWCALAVQDYESRALPLSYGGGRSHNLATQGRARYSFANRASLNGNPLAPRAVSQGSALGVLRQECPKPRVVADRVPERVEPQRVDAEPRGSRQQ